MLSVESPKRLLTLFGSGRSLRRELIGGGLGSFGIKVSTTGIGTILTVVLARALGPADYGIYAFSLAVVSILAIPASMGIPTLMLRETAQSEAAGAWGRMRGFWRWSTVSVGCVSALAALAILAFIWLQPQDWEGAKRTALLLGVALIPLVALGNLRGAALRGLRRVVLGQLPEYIIRPLLLLCFVLAGMLLTTVEMTPQLVMGLHVVAATLAFIFGGVLLFRYRSPRLRARSRSTIQKRGSCRFCRLRYWAGCKSSISRPA